LGFEIHEDILYYLGTRFAASNCTHAMPLTTLDPGTALVVIDLLERPRA